MNLHLELILDQLNEQMLQKEDYYHTLCTYKASLDVICC